MNRPSLTQPQATLILGILAAAAAVLGHLLAHIGKERDRKMKKEPAAK